MQLKPRGFLLLEVLVALLLAALALLALAGSQARAVRAVRSGQQAGQALMLAQDLAERLRTQPGLAVQDGSPYELLLSWSAQQAGASPVAEACNGAEAPCTAEAFARADFAQWRSLLARSLPASAAYVDADPAHGVVQLWVAWREPPLAVDELAGAEGECPAGLGVDAASGVRCVFLKVRP